MAKLFFLDLETTGLESSVHGIHQMSGAIFIDGRQVEEFNFRVQPHKGCLINQEALKVSGTNWNDLKDFPPPAVVRDQLVGMMGKYVQMFHPRDKFHIVGYNNAFFDAPFFRKWFERCGDKFYGSWFWSAPIDVMVLAAQHLREERSGMEDFKLRTVARQLGIEVDESRLHDAQYDIELTRLCYEVVTGLKVLQPDATAEAT